VATTSLGGARSARCFLGHGREPAASCRARGEVRRGEVPEVSSRGEVPEVSSGAVRGARCQRCLPGRGVRGVFPRARGARARCQRCLPPGLPGEVPEVSSAGRARCQRCLPPGRGAGARCQRCLPGRARCQRCLPPGRGARGVFGGCRPRGPGARCQRCLPGRGARGVFRRLRAAVPVRNFGAKQLGALAGR
jgi:hypothetical protein